MKEFVDLVYVGGLFDGEGTVTLTKRKASDMFRAPTLTLTSTTKELVDVCKEVLDGFVVIKKTYKDHHKQAWSWCINGNKAIDAMIRIIPFIREPEKKRRMQHIIDHYKNVTPRNGKYNETSLQLKHKFEAEFFHPSNTVA